MTIVDCLSFSMHENQVSKKPPGMKTQGLFFITSLAAYYAAAVTLFFKIAFAAILRNSRFSSLQTLPL